MPGFIRENRQLRNEAPLNFISLRSLLDCVVGRLSRVEMNAKHQAPLTALPTKKENCAFFGA